MRESMSSIASKIESMESDTNTLKEAHAMLEG